jgi:hypothetical protein
MTRVHITGKLATGEAIDTIVEAPDELGLGDTLTLGTERVRLVAVRTELTPEDVDQIWEIEPAP